MARAGRGSGSPRVDVEPVRGFPALLVRPRGSEGSTLVVADLHLGLGGVGDRPGGPPEASAESMADGLVRLLDRSGASRLVVAGDVKHPIVGTPTPLRGVLFDFFGELLRSGRRIEVVLGNHDVGLTPWLPREVRVHPASGTVRSGVGIFHGHRWPSDRVLASDIVVAGHLHPGFRLAPSPDDPSGKRPCWVRVRREPPATEPRRARRHARLRAREVVILPPFNPIAGLEALNRERPARGRSFLFGRFLSDGEPRAYLLDGTDLGTIPTRTGARPRAAGRAPRAP